MLIFAVFTEYLNEAAGSFALCLTQTYSAEQTLESQDEFADLHLPAAGVGVLQ